MTLWSYALFCVSSCSFLEVGPTLFALAGQEERWHTLGVINGVWVIVVIHTDRDEDKGEIIRIISARKATSSERNFYEK